MVAHGAGVSGFDEIAIFGGIGLIILGLIYMMAYFAAVVLAPIFVITAPVLLLLTRVPHVLFNDLG